MLPMRGTRIVWDAVFEEYKCEKCNAILYYQFDFRYCPYCKRRIVHTDERKAQTGASNRNGVINR